MPEGETCGTCENNTPARHGGFLHCTFMKVWESVSPFAPCFFQPSKWKKREPKRPTSK